MFSASAIYLATGLMLAPMAKARRARGRGPLVQWLKITVVRLRHAINAARRAISAQTVQPQAVPEQNRSWGDRDRL
ncbi:hypothetical protein MVEN_00698900 [Mycena venus]|uniref:Uncharacterized protein n=1 Tax=Mycena venus TaxID=2733690 RepID=A0A8H7D559_9AGAR|nr:hypothetical protein MVEN_00698900 [Mycena venus]